MDIPVLLTCTVNIQDLNVHISSHDTRLSQYQTAIVNWISLGVKSIVICENSGEKIVTPELLDFAEQHSATIEEITFLGDALSISLKGKGFGEGEIINKAISTSNIINNYGCFFKVTGRLFINNFKNINDFILKSKVSSLFYTVDSSKFDTRFFFTTVNFYNKNLQSTHELVNDSEFKYLEHCFCEELFNNNDRKKVSVPYPMFIGVSGSTGGSYQLPTWRFVLKNIFSHAKIYGNTF